MAALFMIALMIPMSGCLEDTNEDGQEGSCIPPLEGVFYLDQEECYMSGLGRWNANYSVINRYNEDSYPVSGVEILGRMEEGDGSQGPSYRYYDANGDELVTEGDYIRFYNMSEDSMIGHNLSCNDVHLTYFEIRCDTEDMKNLLVRTRWVNESEEPGGGWSADITIWMRDDVSGPRTDEIRLGFLTIEGTWLPEAKMTYNDTDGNGYVSSGDTIRVEDLGIDHHRCTVQFIVDNQLVGMTWIILPDID
ncbi:MAG: hypothetical protein GQ558_06855 [Thermoplasmata archaeon]|nr:hypothetical protein [Thermoplasmata archaeon]